MDFITEKSKTGSWSWQIKKKSGIPGSILSDFIDKKGAIVKSNDIREIRLIDGFFVKRETPLSLTGKIMARLLWKARSEFKSAMLLESNGIPCVEYCGWGICGSETIIFSKELKDSENAYDVWFKRLASLPPDSTERSLFLNNLAIFLRKFFKKDIFHPDLHPGNLLVRKNDMEFFVVDPYGIKEIPGISGPKRFRMQRIWGAFRGELSEKEAVDLIIKSEMAADETAAKKLWDEIIYAESEEMKKLWIKRKARMRSGKNSKYFSAVEKENGILFLRKEFRGTLPDDLEKLHSEFIAKKVPWPESERLWLRSLYLQFQRLEHVMPVAWLKKNDGELDIVFWEKETGLCNPEESMKEDFEYFRKRCIAAGITVEHGNIRFDRKFLKFIITNIDNLKKS